MLAPSPVSAASDVADHAGLADLLLDVAPVPPETTSADVYARFRGDAELISIPVVAGDRPVGLVYRTIFMASLAHKYGNALYADKPVTHLMDAQPLIVDHAVSVDELEATIAREKPSALRSGFIVTRDGSYVGVASALSLLRLSMARTQRRNRELEEARSRAEAANEAKSQFLTIMTHELRTPLNAIIGFTDLMQNGTFGKIEPPRYRDYLTDINNAANQLLAIINDVLDMAKIEQGKMKLQEEPVDLKALIDTALRVVGERAQAAQLSLTGEAPDVTVTLKADARALRHILLNLLSNAVKFTPAGGEIVVRLNLRPTGGVELIVADTGIGMTAGHVAVALTPFAQVENAYTRKYEGTGLGLPLVKSLVELHGAELAIDSRLGAGTAVRIRFAAERVLEPALRPALARAS
ncbi:MAG: histidine kinase [Alphaproteobacteria bacterium]|nr:histidine kinase [Alphaproteobacteria bacterium]